MLVDRFERLALQGRRGNNWKMKQIHLVGALLALTLPVLAQPDATEREELMVKLPNGLSFPLVSPEAAQKAVAHPFALHLRDVTLFEALQELQKQSGVELDQLYGGMSSLEKRLSLDVETTSFSRALEAILDEAGVKASLRPWGTGHAWSVGWGDAAEYSNAPQSSVGAFGVRLDGVELITHKKTTFEKKAPASEQSQSLSLNLEIVPAPELKIVGVPRFRLTRVSDQAGHSLLSGPQGSSPFRFEKWRGPQSVYLKMADGARTLTRIEGVAIVVVPTREESLEIPNATEATGIERRFGRGDDAVTLTIEAVKRTVDFVSLRLKIVPIVQDKAGHTHNPLLWAEFVAASLKLKSADGRVLSALNYQTEPGDQDLTVWIGFRPDFVLQPGQQWPIRAEPAYPTGPLTLILNAPTAFVQTEIPFSFSEIPLP